MRECWRVGRRHVTNYATRRRWFGAFSSNEPDRAARLGRPADAMIAPNRPEITVAASPGRWRTAGLAEWAAVFLVFFLQGAWPVPDVNEPHYLGKAIHYWNRDWIPADFFLDSADTHQVFYFTFGWLSLGLGPAALAWTGRVLTWGLMAWAWRRLSTAVVPRPWFAVLTAGLLVTLIERFHMAGEWLVGGVEAKGFAWVLVLLGMEAVVRNRWNRAWLLLGAASAFHVLVGGWAAVAAGIAWLGAGRGRVALRATWPGLAGGFLLALPGLLPSLRLTWGVDAALVREANRIYVCERLAHHLDFTAFAPAFCVRFAALAAFALWLLWMLPQSAAVVRLRRFCLGTLAIGACGAVLSFALAGLPDARAAVLRFYWFRTADVVVPAAASLAVAAWAAERLGGCSRWRGAWLAGAAALAAVHVGGYALMRPLPAVPRGFRAGEERWKGEAGRLADYLAWRKACAWIADPAHVPPDARFLTPRLGQTFKWYAGRSEVATWKDIPQDAASIVAWWERLREVYGTGSDEPGRRWVRSLADRKPAELAELGHKYEARYLLVESKPRLPMEVVYRNERWAVYRLPKAPPRTTARP